MRIQRKNALSDLPLRIGNSLFARLLITYFRLSLPVLCRTSAFLESPALGARELKLPPQPAHLVRLLPRGRLGLDREQREEQACGTASIAERENAGRELRILSRLAPTGCVRSESPPESDVTGGLRSSSRLFHREHDCGSLLWAPSEGDIRRVATDLSAEGRRGSGLAEGQTPPGPATRDPLDRSRSQDASLSGQRRARMARDSSAGRPKNLK